MRLRRGDRAFEIEPRGINYLPRSDRRLTPRGLSAMWAGSSFNIEYVVWGALVASLGLSLLQSLVVIVVGNLSWCLTGLASVQGPEAGTTAFGVSRAVYGPRPNRVLAGTNWLTQVGFETLGLAFVVLAGLALDIQAGGHPEPATKIAIVLGAAAVQGLVPWFGHATLAAVLRWCAWVFGASWSQMSVAMVIVLSAGGIGWTENANDYSRYLPPGLAPRRIVVAVGLGGGLPVVLAEVMGAAIASIVAHPGTISVISGLPSVFPAWFTVPYLILVIAQLLAINGLDLYSSGVSLQATGVPIHRTQCVAVDTIVCAGLTAWAVFSGSFTTALDDFAQMIVVWIAPWLAVFLVDGALRHGRYDLRSLFSSDGGIYRRRSGTNWHAVVAQLVGMIAALSWINTSVFIGPLSRLTGRADLSIYLGAGSAGLCYWLTARAMVHGEVHRSAIPGSTGDLELEETSLRGG